MEKSPQAFRTISEVSEVINVPAHVLRFWESRFSQVRPVKRGGGRRYYRPEDVDLLRVIRELLYTEGLTIRGVQKLLKESGQKQLIEKYADGITIDDFGATQDEAAAEADSPDEALFDDMSGVELVDETPEDDSPAPAPMAAEKRAALARILGDLETLRGRMATPVSLSDPE
ncbi:DNA-binding transcriptional MerR regulator [Rubricella aquisinus]|uniref:DNA-binding transcriptional MerR regulator n=1 Tax=Rubricella aquisinus TaxID=2028108 RepID=A0A840WRS3_9RHOB|nr:MerR family transcriptional regulator [Rubricella aquisinus]MBB5516362.1 DNA-binding transcriptional MerR regulator [Rubricella aquisinus]